MRLLLLALMVTGCAAAHETPCGIDVGGDRDDPNAPSSLTAAALQSAVRRALDGATFTTDPHLSDSAENCKAMEGFTVYTRAAPSFIDDGEEVFGATRCWNFEVIMGTPESGDWGQSGLVHELFHVMQRCTPPRHENWERDGIFLGIGKGEDRLR
ncbi:MAG: hypothetical protein Q8K32_09300 [Archangium sp.]|nr:hypothetical protein [Archangium sp.]